VLCPGFLARQPPAQARPGASGHLRGARSVGRHPVGARGGDGRLLPRDAPPLTARAAGGRPPPVLPVLGRDARQPALGREPHQQRSRGRWAVQAPLDAVHMEDLAYTCLNDEAPPPPRLGITGAEAVREREHRLWQGELTTVHSADDGLNAIIAQALADIFMLTVAPEPGTPHAADRFVYAGIPWFATIFGRDALITAREMLTFAPGLARSVLRTLGALQGSEVNPERDEEPGKIIHAAR